MAASDRPETVTHTLFRVEIQTEWVGSLEEGKSQGGLEELEIRTHLSRDPKWSVFMVTEVERPLRPKGRAAVEEAYLDLGPATRLLRLGRYRLPFGIYERGEVDYSGMIELPLVKSEGTLGMHLTRVVSGTQWIRSRPPYRLQAALMNSDPTDRWSASFRGAGAAVRVERMAGPLVLGLDAYSGRMRGSDSGRASALGVDWRYATQGLQLRGEAILGGGSARHERGLYADLWVHSPDLPDLTGLLRWETADLGEGRRRRWTVGGRYQLSRRPDTMIALNLLRDSPRREGAPYRLELLFLLLQTL